MHSSCFKNVQFFFFVKATKKIAIVSEKWENVQSLKESGSSFGNLDTSRTAPAILENSASPENISHSDPETTDPLFPRLNLSGLQPFHEKENSIQSLSSYCGAHTNRLIFPKVPKGPKISKLKINRHNRRKVIRIIGHDTPKKLSCSNFASCDTRDEKKQAYNVCKGNSKQFEAPNVDEREWFQQQIDALLSEASLPQAEILSIVNQVSSHINSIFDSKEDGFDVEKSCTKNCSTRDIETRINAYLKLLKLFSDNTQLCGSRDVRNLLGLIISILPTCVMLNPAKCEEKMDTESNLEGLESSQTDSFDEFEHQSRPQFNRKHSSKRNEFRLWIQAAKMRETVVESLDLERKELEEELQLLKQEEKKLNKQVQNLEQEVRVSQVLL